MTDGGGSLAQYRRFLKDSVRKEVDFSRTPQAQGQPAPPLQKPSPQDAKLIALASPSSFDALAGISLLKAMRSRESRRAFSAKPLSIEELSFLLWATQGVRNVLGHSVSFRTVPSAGARHALETYVYAQRVATLEEGVYRYLPLDHKLALVYTENHLAGRFAAACFGQAFVGAAAALFVWSCVPYRMEWRYGLAAHKVIALDAGHVAQNLYLASEAIGAGTCAVAAYDQQYMDSLLQLDGEDEFVIYLAPVGKQA